MAADEKIDSQYEDALERFRRDLDQHHPMYVDGQEVRSDEGEFLHKSPIDTSIVVGHFEKGSRKHARLAIEAARRAFATWNGTHWPERVRIIRGRKDAA
jgi:1-pyrroline-5-carboxylate dehydrogenase